VGHTNHTLDRVIIRAYLATKLAKEVSKIWMVRDPLPDEVGMSGPTSDRLVFEMTVPRLVEYLSKIGLRRWQSERGTLHTDSGSADADAERRVERFSNRYRVRLAEEGKEGVTRKVKQRGTALRTRRKQYRKTKQKSKLQAKKWRKSNPGKYKRQQKRYQSNPSKFSMKRRAESPEVAELDIPIWNLETDQPGEIDQLHLDEGTVTISYGGEPQELDVLNLLDEVVLVDPEDETELFDLLDVEVGAEDGEVEAMTVYSYDRRVAGDDPKSRLEQVGAYFTRKYKNLESRILRGNEGPSLIVENPNDEPYYAGSLSVSYIGYADMYIVSVGQGSKTRTPNAEVNMSVEDMVRLAERLMDRYTDMLP